ncbi:MAG: hypothetical protein LIP12_14565 [Clostridiales bacterium]|nr:hypothetical protein [Clostridiales bacterium]
MKKIMRNKPLAVLAAALLMIYTIWGWPYIKNILTDCPFFGENGLLYIENGMLAEVICLLMIWALLISLFVDFATVVTIDHEKITVSFLFMKLKTMNWTDVKCVGLIEQGILRERNKYKRSIYISDEIPDLRTRLLMCAELYGTDKSEHRICLKYRKKDLEFIDSIWEGPYIIDTGEKFHNDTFTDLDRRITELEEENEQLMLRKEELGLQSPG